MLKHWTVGLAIPMMLAACADQGARERGDRGPGGKADHFTGTCTPADCGGPSSDGTGWCDEACASHGDCAEGVAEACGLDECQDDAGCHAGESCLPGVCPFFCEVDDPDCCEPNTCAEPIEPGECGDGTQAVCTVVPEPCPDGLVREVVNNCYGACVDPTTCLPPPEPITCGDAGGLCVSPSNCGDGTIVDAACDTATTSVCCVPDQPITCEDIGGECLSSPIDVTFPANCEGDFGLETADAACPSFTEACCVEPAGGEQCGDVTCAEGTTCCNPLLGICTAPGQFCILE